MFHLCFFSREPVTSHADRTLVANFEKKTSVPVTYTITFVAPTVTVKGLNTAYHVAYIVGIGNGKVNPLGTITRAEVATIFFRLMDDDFRTKYWDNDSSYADVADDAWYDVAVATLENAGVIKDTAAGGSFRPTDPITRAELAVMAAQFAAVAGTWYYEAVQEAANSHTYTRTAQTLTGEKFKGENGRKRDRQ